MMWALYIVGAAALLTAILVAAMVLYGRTIPVGHVVAVEIDLKKSPEEIYALVSDVPGHVRWAPKVRAITEAPPDQGRPAYRMRVDSQEMLFYVSAAEPPRVFTLTVPGDKMFRGTWTWDITRTAGGGGRQHRPPHRTRRDLRRVRPGHAPPPGHGNQVPHPESLGHGQALRRAHQAAPRGVTCQ